MWLDNNSPSTQVGLERGEHHVGTDAAHVHSVFVCEQVTSASAQQFSAGERVTDVLDSEGMFYLQVLILPLIVATSLYALKHYTYKSWWSWAISSLADASYVGCRVCIVTINSEEVMARCITLRTFVIR